MNDGLGLTLFFLFIPRTPTMGWCHMAAFRVGFLGSALVTMLVLTAMQLVGLSRHESS